MAGFLIEVPHEANGVACLESREDALRILPPAWNI